MQLENFNYINETDQNICKEFLESKNKRFVLGRNKWSKSILSLLDIAGIVDDFTDDTLYETYKIYKMKELPKDAIIVSVTTCYPKTAKNKLNSLGIKNIDYFAFYKYSKLDLEKPPFIDGFKNGFLNNKDRYNSIYNQLADKKSQEIFQNILNFKITLDLKFMNQFSNNKKLQYFEDDFYKIPSNPVFVDGGGYIGDTTMIFIDKVKNYKKIFLFEPTTANMKSAQENLQNSSHIDFIEVGLSNFDGDVFFNEDDASSSICNAGSLKIKVNTLDNIIQGKVDFIKLDIEGAEQNAINGAKNLISNFKPILAICIYHKAEDWYKIPEQILNMHNDYKIFIRHYTEGITETVMYFIPPNRLK